MSRKVLEPSSTKVYVTKRILERSSRSAIKQASSRAMHILGYSVEANDGWVVKKYADGRLERISKLPSVKRPTKLVLH